MNNAPQDHQKTLIGIRNRRRRWMHISSAIISCRGGDSGYESSHSPTNQYVRPSVLVEMDTNIGRYSGLRNHVNKDNSSLPRQVPSAPTISLSLDVSQCLRRTNATTILIQQPDDVITASNSDAPLPPSQTIRISVTTLWTLVSQTALLLPSLLITRRILNSTSNAVVDYFRGRYLRTTFTRLERAYLRYYEFPAAARAVFRVASQIGILLSLSWVVRWWLWIVLKTGGEDVVSLSTLVGATIEPLGVTSWDFENSYLPCHRAGMGVPWLCGLIWTSSVVGLGHAFAMALSKWGGPLRLQAVSAHQQPQTPTHVLSWIIHHPIQWLRGLDEWKYLSSLANLTNRNNPARAKRRWKSFNPDPLLFPVTWMPLRWLQIYAISKAFATEPELYRWCSPEKQTVIIHQLMKIYLVQVALGDEWSRVFLGEYRVGLGIVVVSCYFVAVSWMLFTTFTLNVGSSLLLIPSLLAAFISVFMNVRIFWNRMGTKEQKKALSAMGWTNHNT